MISGYDFAGRREYCLHIDRGRARKVMIIAPLFWEHNRCRHMLVELMRALDDLGLDSVMPDLPGQNESLHPEADVDLQLWQEALAACAHAHGNPDHIVSLRGGCLLDHVPGACAIWRLAPLRGDVLLRHMLRSRMLADHEHGMRSDRAMLLETGRSKGLELGGHFLSASMISQLENALPAHRLPVHLACLEDDPASADAYISGKPLWLRAEPSHDPAMAIAMADNIAGWHL